MKNKYKSSYNSKDEVPKAVRDLYTSKEGKWVFDGDSFEGLAEDLNPGLATNKDKLLQEKKDAERDLEAETERADEAEKELRKLQKPGMKVINEDEAKQLQSYQALGTAADLEKMKEEHAAQFEEITKSKTEKDTRKFCEDHNLNFDAVQDLLATRAKGAKLLSKKEKSADGKADVDVPYISIDVDEDGKTKTSETTLKKYAEDSNLPTYLTNALFSVEDKSNSKKSTSAAGGGIKMPDLSGGGSSNTDNKGEAKTAAAKFQERRDQGRVLPWSKPATES